MTLVAGQNGCGFGRNCRVAEVRMVLAEDGQGFGCCVCVDSVLVRRLHVAHRPQRVCTNVFAILCVDNVLV